VGYAHLPGAVWISHLKRPGHFKLPATRALALTGVRLDVPELPVTLDGAAGETFREIAYEERAGVGYLHFDFYNGAMSTDQCRRLLEAYRYARGRDTRVIVLMGGADFFCNGIHLNVIEAAGDPAAESWCNLHAIDDVVREVLETGSQLVISALTGDAAAGGVPFALAADHVLARADVVLNPYCRHMGGLYSSEDWTYLLPRRVGPATTARLTSAPFEPLGTRRAVEVGLLDAAFGATAAEFQAGVRRFAEQLADDPDLGRAWPPSAAPASATRPASRSRPTAPRSSPGRTCASSGPTAATTPLASCTAARPARPLRAGRCPCGGAAQRRCAPLACDRVERVATAADVTRRAALAGSYGRGSGLDRTPARAHRSR